MSENSMMSKSQTPAVKEFASESVICLSTNFLTSAIFTCNDASKSTRHKRRNSHPEQYCELCSYIFL